jgi:anti-anti-sigma regulatory factor
MFCHTETSAVHLAFRLHDDHCQSRENQMPIRITQQEYDNGDRPYDCDMVLKIEGSLYLEDAELLERICHDIGKQTGYRLALDLADLSFLDSESASVLCRLKRHQDVSLEGLHLFIAKVIELTEAEAKVSTYLSANK